MFQCPADFLEDFYTFLESAPDTSPPRRLYAAVTVSYSMALGGEHLHEYTVYKTEAAPVEGSKDDWWMTHVWFPVVRFLTRFVDGHIDHITYRYA